jgi:membrane fusion protein, multidrug efflux system
VTVAKATQKTVPIQLQAIGTVQASSTVAVTPQATGQVTGVYFQKGQLVRKGQLLFTLDNRTQRAAIQQAQGTLARDLAQVRQAEATLAKDQGLVQQAQTTLNRDLAQVRQAEATLAKDQAQSTYARATSQRYNDLYSQGGISRDQAQQYSANSASSSATLQVDRAAIANANALKTVEVQATYTKIYAPIDGKAGNILVTAGNIVQANSTSPLVNLTKVHPIQVAFAVPESNLPAIQRHMENGRLKVTVAFTGNGEKPLSGYLTFLNNTVDSTTGTIQLIGDFENTSGKLFPGQFVKTTLTLTQEPNATVVPSQAVQTGPNGQFVFVVKPDDTVENVPVTATGTVNGLSVIQKGIEPGQSVVTDGQANLVTGSKIRNKTATNNEDDFSNLSGPSRDLTAGSGKARTAGKGHRSSGNAGQQAGPPANSPPASSPRVGSPDASSSSSSALGGSSSSSSPTASPSANPTAGPSASPGSGRRDRASQGSNAQ